MIFAVLRGDDLTGIFVSIFVGAYLIYVLVRPERL
jgi:hypothetical protein